MVLQSQCCLDFQQFSLDILKTLFVVLLILYADESQAGIPTRQPESRVWAMLVMSQLPCTFPQ